MKGILLAFLMFVISSIVMIFALMKFTPKNKFKSLLFVHNVLALILIFLHLVTPDNLWFLPTSILENYPLVDLANSIILYQLFFWFITANFYSLTSRGFSLGRRRVFQNHSQRKKTSPDIFFDEGCGQNRA